MGRIITINRSLGNLELYSGENNAYAINILTVRAVTYDEKNGYMSIKTDAETIVLHSGQGNWTRSELTEAFVNIQEYFSEIFGNKVICTEGGKLYTLTILK